MTAPPLTQWERARRWIRRVEGGYVNDPKDRGGETNRGITWRALREGMERGIVPRSATVRDLTEAQTDALYQALYYHEARCQDLPVPLGLAVFDAAVHSGLKHAGQWLQRSLNESGGSVAVDGLIGYRTIAEAHARPTGPVLHDLLEMRREFLRALIRADPTQQRFERGWRNRIDELEAECRLAMEAA